MQNKKSNDNFYFYFLNKLVCFSSILFLASRRVKMNSRGDRKLKEWGYKYKEYGSLIELRLLLSYKVKQGSFILNLGWKSFSTVIKK